MIASSCFDLEPFWKFQISILSSEIGTFSKNHFWAFQLLKRSNLVFRASLMRWEGLQALESIWGHFESFKSDFGAIFSELLGDPQKARFLRFRPWSAQIWLLELVRGCESDCKLLLWFGAILKISNFNFELWDGNFFQKPFLSFSAPETLKSSF